MEIRRYRSTDCKALAELFYDTVHAVNARDYTKAQLDAWATGRVDLAAWDRSFREHFTVVAEEGGCVVGFGDMAPSGYLDRLYVHAGFLRRGIATALCDQLEASVQGDIVTQASLTAKPFFAKRGYQVVRVQEVVRQGIALTNVVMKKVRASWA